MTGFANTIERSRFLNIAGLLLAMSIGADLVFFAVWGLWLFPAGNMASKFVWTMTCGVAMSSVVTVAILAAVEGRMSGARAFVAAALIPFAVFGICTLLCARIDETFNYFGSAESPLTFLASGLIPAALGGLLFAALLYRGR